MAFPFKTGGDFYNCEAQRMRLHNLGANPTETATGLMYFNTGASNLGKHAVVHDGTNFKALAFVDEIATNTAFTELAERVDDLETALGTDEKDVLDTWEEVKTFLASIKESDGDLMTMLNSKADKTQLADYLPLSGGTISSAVNFKLTLNATNADNYNLLGFSHNGEIKAYIGTRGGIFSITTNGAENIDFNGNTLLHSGNITEVLDDLNNATGARFFAGTFQASNRPNMGVNYAAGLTIHDIAIDRRHQISFDNAGNLFARSQKSGGWYAWKTIAFTDSDITGYSAGLKHSNGTVGATVKSNGDVDFAKNILLMGNIVKYNDNNVAYFGSAQDGLGESYDGALMYAYGQRNLYFYTGKDIRMLINSSGNVTIGDSDREGTSAKLYVDGNIYASTNVISNGHFFMTDTQGSANTAIDKSGDTILFGYGFGIKGYDIYYTGYNVHIEAGGGWKTGKNISLLHNGNVLIGDTTDNSKGKLQVKGDLYVDGNIIATKEVSAGGAGQEGESGDGGAEVISQPLAKGQSTYTITNTIKRSDIAVSLYEANVINGQTIWSLCLADIEVTNDTITVTFGSATSVNHKLVAVG